MRANKTNLEQTAGRALYYFPAKLLLLLLLKGTKGGGNEMNQPMNIPNLMPGKVGKKKVGNVGASHIWGGAITIVPLAPYPSFRSLHSFSPFLRFIPFVPDSSFPFCLPSSFRPLSNFLSDTSLRAFHSDSLPPKFPLFSQLFSLAFAVRMMSWYGWIKEKSKKEVKKNGLFLPTVREK